MHFELHVNSVRLDLRPYPPHAADLCLGSVNTLFPDQKQGYYKCRDFTLKYTRKLYITVFWRRPFRGRDHLISIIHQLNSLKKTPVQYFTDTPVINIQCNGTLGVQCSDWSLVTVPDTFQCFLSIDFH